MKVAEDVFTIPLNAEEFLLHVPLLRKTLVVNKEVIDLLGEIKENNYNGRNENIVNQLKKERVLVTRNSHQKIEETKFLPSGGILLTTTDCPLSCTYCFADLETLLAENSNIVKNMPEEIAFRAIDFMFQNAQIKGTQKISLSYVGVGECFSNFPLIKNSYNYAFEKTKSKENLNISIVTNGMLSKEMLDWVVTHANIVQVSLDGSEDIQNYQRPLKNGNPSFPRVVHTINYLKKRGVNVKIRATITNYSVGRMEEILNFFSSLTDQKSFQLQPVSECGKCGRTNTSIDMDMYASEVLSINQKFKEDFPKIVVSGLKYNHVKFKYCGASGSNFIITPDGNITSCPEVVKSTDPRYNIFVYGKITKDKVEIDENKLGFLNSLNVNSFESCNSCFAKYDCGGGCIAHSAAEGNIYKQKESICNLTREIIKADILKAMGWA